MSASRAKAQAERKASGGASRIWGASGSAQVGGVGGAKRDGGRREPTQGQAPSRDARPHSAPNGSAAGGFGRGDSGRDRTLAATDAATAGCGNGIEARLGIVKKNRRSSSSSIPGGLESLDLTKDDNSESRRRIAEYIGRYGTTLHRAASEQLRREGRASTPDGSGRSRAKSASTAEGLHSLEVYEVPDRAAELVRGDAAFDRPHGGAPLCPAAVEPPDQCGAALPLLGFAHSASDAELRGLDGLLEHLVSESTADEPSEPGRSSLWHHLRRTDGCTLEWVVPDGAVAAPSVPPAAAGGAGARSGQSPRTAQYNGALRSYAAAESAGR
eukprot:TRINITY_DN7697_c0_g1_i2.p1 TRINITY_DN7697_c0_g1~~TRINITY_DN7697_c0_g1_i2.p1  ORF type:complete len:328 (+),score=116.04 TRINITY_DN7697_c0_g1_i2:234-1217(+)